MINTHNIPKAELHLHLEGSMKPSLVRQLAKRNGIVVPETLFAPDETYIWKDFLDFLSTYDKVTAVLKNKHDYRDMTYAYLAECVRANTVYAELLYSSDHALLCGISIEESLEGVIQGIEDAKRDFGIEARILLAFVRHFGVDKCIEVAKWAAANPHPLITGVNLAGDEIHFPAEQFSKAFRIAADAGLGCTTHAGEMLGPESVWQAINTAPITRVGHGVRSIEDPKLIQTLIERNITLEVCPGSNVALQVYPDFVHHPLRQLKDLGVKLTLSSDDPPFFATTLAIEYENAVRYFNFSQEELLEMTRHSLNAAFIDEETRRALLERLK